ncbi:tRNA pseudouridine(13) synthase TruD [Kushneria aurantia]|uniref:tRNA pseudouridine(13) synthase TruD n=1 Tax=Kushneria aurantia TaxID=504092 RepID=A0ABV6FZ03_9GAMM|nr:tRNA pseudouridine(13) synthase TruD [Kushneria aurantia]
MSEQPALPDWPRALGTPPHGGRFRESAEDFRVEEVLPFEPEGEGQHLWLECEKRALSTPQLVRHLSHCFEVAPRDIGVSGLKDHTAITRQWLSVALDGHALPADPAALIENDSVRLLQWRRHPRKLKRGVHRANRFSLVVRGARPWRPVRWRRALPSCARAACPTTSVRSASAMAAAI